MFDDFINKFLTGWGGVVGGASAMAVLLGTWWRTRGASLAAYVDAQGKELKDVKVELKTCHDELQAVNEYVLRLQGALISNGISVPPR